MRFNTKTGRYEITIQDAKENFEMNFKDDGILQKRITLNSRKIYNYLYYRSNSYNKAVVDFMLHKTKEGREFLYDLMFEQLAADLQTGYNSITYMPSVNVATGQSIDRNALRMDQVCIEAENVADRSMNYFGFNLLISVPFDPSMFRFVNNYNRG